MNIIMYVKVYKERVLVEIDGVTTSISILIDFVQYIYYLYPGPNHYTKYMHSIELDAVMVIML